MVLHQVTGPFPDPAAQKAPPFPRPVRVFVGRQEEVRRVADLLSQEVLFLVYGIAGIGKSEFVYKVIEEARCTPWGRCATPVLLQAQSCKEDLADVARALEARPYIVFLDDVHDLDMEVVGPMLHYLSRHVSRSRIFVASRLELLLPPGTPPPIVTRLHPLSAADTAEMVALLSHSMGIQPSDPVEIFRRSGGSPSFVRRELASLRYVPETGEDSLLRALRELPSEARQVLLLARLMGGRLATADLPHPGAVWELLRRFFIDIDRGRIIVPGLIGDTLSWQVDPGEVARARQAAATVHLRRFASDPQRYTLDVVDAVQHLLLCGDGDRAWETLRQSYEALAVAQGPPGTGHFGWPLLLSSLLDDRLEEAARTAAAAQAFCGKGCGQDLQEFGMLMAMLETIARVGCDQVARASSLLDKILFRAAASDALPEHVAALHRGIVLCAEGDMPAGRTALYSAVTALEAHRDDLLLAVATYHLGCTKLALGDVEGAQLAGSHAATLARSVGMEPLWSHAEVLHARALLCAFHLDAASAKVQRVLQSPHLPSRVRCMAHCLLAKTHAISGDREAAHRELEQAAKAAGSMAAPRIEVDLEGAEILLLCGSVGPSVLDRAERAKAHYEQSGRRYLEARAQLCLAAALISADGAGDVARRDEALSRAEDLCTRNGYGLLLLRHHLIEAALRHRRGEARRARALLSRTLCSADPAEDGLELRLLREALKEGGEGEAPVGLRALLEVLGLSAVRRYEIIDRGGRRDICEAEARRAMEAHDLVADVEHGAITARGGRSIAGRHLTCSLLARLAASQGQVVGAESLFYEVWGGREYHPLQHRNTIYVAITRLRRALRELVPDRDVVETAASGWRLARDADVCVIRPKG